MNPARWQITGRVQILEHEPLSRHTTLRTGGLARFFVVAQTADDVGEAVRFARAHTRPAGARNGPESVAGQSVVILGDGSNVLAGDAPFDGVVIRLAHCGLSSRPLPGDRVEITAEAGEEWDGLVEFAVRSGWYGLENMSLIPGTVGAAVAGNIGAYGAEVKDTLLWLEALDLRTGALRRFSVAESQLAYRYSFFKTPDGRHFIIMRAAFGLRRGGVVRTAFKELRDYLADRAIASPTLLQARQAVSAIRQHKLPDVSQVGTAGSFFKNPVIPLDAYERLRGQYSGLPGYPEPNGTIKVPLAWILDKVCGLRGINRGRVGTHSEQALVIVNRGGQAAEVAALADELAQAVQAKTGLVIEWEVERVGAWGSA